MAEEKTTDKDGLLNDLDINFDTQFDPDKALGLATSAIQPKKIDNTAIDAQISQIEKPSGGSVYDKMAARYRSQGEGTVLRTQKNLGNLFLPTINLIKEREANAQARFTLLKDKMPEFDDSTIFGNQSGNEMPIKDYVMDISKSVKEDLRMLSRLNPNDERYDEIKKRVDKNQKAIVDFDDINQQLLKIRNTDNDESQWSAGMDQTTADMWRDIYSSKGENIKIVDGKLVWTDTRSETSYEFKGGSFIDDKWEALGKDDTDLGYLASSTRDDAGNQYTFENGDKGNRVKDVQEALINGGFTDTDGNELDADGEWGNKSQAAYDKYLEQKDGLEKAYLDENYKGDAKKTSGTGGTRTIDLSQIGDGPTMIDNKGLETDIEIQDAVQGLINSNIPVDDPRYDAKVNQLVRKLNSAGPKGIKSLIFDGIDGDPTDPLASTNTNAFIEDVIRYNHGEKLSEEEIDNIIDGMRDKDVTFSYKNSEGKDETLQSQYIKWYRNQIDLKVKEGKKSKLFASSSSNSNSNSNNRRSNNNNTSDIPDPEDELADPTKSFFDQNVTADQKGNLWKTFWNKSEGEAQKDLEALFGKDTEFNFSFVQRTPMFDEIEVYDANGKSLGVHSFDQSNPEDAKFRANKFLKKLEDEGYFKTPESKTKVDTEVKKELKTYNEITKILPTIEANETLAAMASYPSNHTKVNGSKVSFIVQQDVVDRAYEKGALNHSYGKGASQYTIKSGGSGSTYGVINGAFGSLSEAEFRKSELTQNGFYDSFVIAIIDGKRVEVEDAITFLNK